MDIKKILFLLKVCTDNILNKALKGQGHIIAHAFEFQLILVGERVNNIINIIESYVFNSKDLFMQLLQQMNIPFDEAKIVNPEEIEYTKRLFRQAFNKTVIGNNLMFLNTSRNNLKHTFEYMLDADHEVFRKFYNQGHLIQKFLNQLKEVIFDEKLKPDIIINNLFTNKTIAVLPSVEMEEITSLFPAKKKKKVEKLNFEEQKAKIFAKLKRFQVFLELLTTYSKQLELENKKLGKWQAKDHTPLHATCMCLVAIGESASGLLHFCNNAEKYDKSLRATLHNHKELLDILFEVSKDLTHEINQLPNAIQILQLYETVSEESKPLLTLVTKIEKLTSSISQEQQFSNEPKRQNVSEVLPDKQSQNMIQSTVDFPDTFFALDVPLNKDEQDSKKRKLTEEETKEGQPDSKRPQLTK